MANTRPVNLSCELYESVKKVSERHGHETVSRFVNELLTDYGFDSEDVKVMLRIPADVAADSHKAESFLQDKVRHVMAQLFP